MTLTRTLREIYLKGFLGLPYQCNSSVNTSLCEREMPIGSSLFTLKYTFNSLGEGRRGPVPAYEEADSGEVVAQRSGFDPHSFWLTREFDHGRLF
jgi:hypothetical protein